MIVPKHFENLNVLHEKYHAQPFLLHSGIPADGCVGAQPGGV